MAFNVFLNVLKTSFRDINLEMTSSKQTKVSHSHVNVRRKAGPYNYHFPGSPCHIFIKLKYKKNNSP